MFAALVQNWCNFQEFWNSSDNWQASTVGSQRLIGEAHHLLKKRHFTRWRQFVNLIWRKTIRDTNLQTITISPAAGFNSAEIAMLLVWLNCINNLMFHRTNELQQLFKQHTSKIFLVQESECCFFCTFISQNCIPVSKRFWNFIIFLIKNSRY